MNKSILATSALLLFIAAACSVPKQTYHVQVVNNTSDTLCVGLVKQAPTGSRPLLDPGWDAPEDIGINAPELSQRRWGMLIPPGQTRILGPSSARFPTGIGAVLRVYLGDHTIQQLLAFSRTDRDRLDVPLTPGANRVIIRSQNERLVADPNVGVAPSPVPAAAPAK